MIKLNELLEMWSKDTEIDRTEPGKALLDIPKLHSKYLNILSHYRLAIRDTEFKLNKMRKLKWEYYTGKLDDDELEKYGWEPFRLVLKTDITTYLDSDDDLNKIKAQKIMYEEIVEVCVSIIKELNSRTYQLRGFIEYEKFIQGV